MQASRPLITELEGCQPLGSPCVPRKRSLLLRAMHLFSPRSRYTVALSANLLARFALCPSIGTFCIKHLFFIRLELFDECSYMMIAGILTFFCYLITDFDDLWKRFYNGVTEILLSCLPTLLF